MDADDDTPHTTWDRILKATREPKTSLYGWVDSFTLHILRHSESTAKPLTKRKKIKINKVISKQITEDEKLIITTINSTYTSDYISKGDYILGDLINLLAQHTSNFAAKRYQPNEHPRIIAYLKTRARSAGIPLPGFMSINAKSTTAASSLKRRRIAQPTQIMWTYLSSDAASKNTSINPPHDKGKPEGKGKGKGKSKSKGKTSKGKSCSSGKGTPKGKGKYNSWNTKGKGMSKGNKSTRPFPQKRPHPVIHGANSSGTSDNSHVKGTSSSNTSAPPTIRCHFCNKLGHYKSNCRQYQSLRNSSAYQARLSHPARTQLIYDHLEDSVFAPKNILSTSYQRYFHQTTSLFGRNCRIQTTFHLEWNYCHRRNTNLDGHLTSSS